QLLEPQHQVEADHSACAIGELMADHALATAALQRVLAQHGALTQPALRDGQQLCYVLVTFLHHHQADDGVTSAQPYADDPLGRPACVTDVALVEPYRLSRAGTEHDVGLAIGDAHCHEFVVV